MLQKIIYLTLVLFTFNSCSLDEGLTQDNLISIAEIESVHSPETFSVGEASVFTLNVKFLSDCTDFQDFRYEEEDNKRFIYVLAKENFDANCNEALVIQEVNLEFTPLYNQEYIFNFFSGINENGESEFINISLTAE